MKLKGTKMIYHLIITIVFVYIFVQFLTLKNSNYIYHFYTKYIMDKYCLVLYISLLFIVVKYDIYTTILLFILIIGPFKCSTKEYFENNTTIPNMSTQPSTTNLNTTQANTTQPNTTQASTIQLSTDKKVTDNLLGIDDRFKMDDIKKNELLRQIKAQINFDPYKTELSKDVIYEIYNKYFDNDVFVKLNSIDEDSKNYIASGNFNYIPKENKADFDITKYENLNKNTAFGINSEADDSNKSSK